LRITLKNNNNYNFGCVCSHLAQQKIPYALIKRQFQQPENLVSFFQNMRGNEEISSLINGDHSKSAGWFLILLGKKSFGSNFTGKSAEFIKEQIKNLITAGKLKTLKPIIKLMAKTYENGKLSLYYLSNAAEQLINAGNTELLKPITASHLNIITDCSRIPAEVSQAAHALGKISETLIKENKFDDLAEIEKVLFERLNNKYVVIQQGESDCISAIAKAYADKNMFEKIKPFTDAIRSRIDNKAFIQEEVMSLGEIGKILAENGRYDELASILKILSELSKHRNQQVKDNVINCLACHIGPALKAKDDNPEALQTVKDILASMPKHPLYG